MGAEDHETAKQLVELFKTVFGPENVEFEILHNNQGLYAYAVWGCIFGRNFSFSIGSDSFDLYLGLGWKKHWEFAYAHQRIGPHTRRRKPTYRKISKFWEMIERLKAIGYEEAPEGYDENPYSFNMVLYHPTPVRLNTPEAREQLIEMIRKTITITREENPWAIAES